MLVVTACNRRYFHGARVLWNSFQHHHRGTADRFWCLAFGDEELVNDLRHLGMPVADNPVFPSDCVMKRELTWLNHNMYDDDAIKALYSRLMLPNLFPDSERVLWVDADSNFIGPISELDDFNMHGKVIAGPLTNKEDGLKKRTGRGGQHIRTGTLLFDTQKFVEGDYIEKCFDVMRHHSDLIDGSASEFVINYVFRNQAADLPKRYSYSAKRQDVGKGVKLIHWSIMEPWNAKHTEPKPQKAKDQVERYWKPYDY